MKRTKGSRKPEEVLKPKDVSMSLLESRNDENDEDGDLDDVPSGQMNSEAYWQTSAEEVEATKDVKAPGVFQLYLSITPLIEIFGYLKDHRESMKKHWVASKKSNGSNLKATIQGLAESELIFGSLVLGILWSVMGDFGDEKVAEAWNDFDYTSIEFWWGGIGCMAIVFTSVFTVTSYILSILTGAISSANFYAFASTTPSLTLLNIPSTLMVLATYSTLAFTVITLIKFMGGSLAAVIFIVTPMVVIAAIVLINASAALNLSLKSGCYSEIPLFRDEDYTNLNPEQINNVLSARALRHDREGHFQERYLSEDFLTIDKFYRQISVQDRGDHSHVHHESQIASTTFVKKKLTSLGLNGQSAATEKDGWV